MNWPVLRTATTSHTFVQLTPEEVEKGKCGGDLLLYLFSAVLIVGCCVSLISGGPEREH